MSGIVKYAAPYARVCGLKGHLLDLSEWKRIREIGDPRELLDWLDRRELISSDNLSLGQAEMELKGSTIEVTEKILRFVGDGVRKVLRFGIYYYDLLNLTIVCRRIHEGGEGENLSAWLYDTGRRGLLAKERLILTESFPALLETVRETLFHLPLANALDAYASDGDIARLLEELEYAFLADWKEALKRELPEEESRTSWEVFVGLRALDAAMRIKFCRTSDEGTLSRWFALIPSPHSKTEMWEILRDADSAEALNKLSSKLALGESALELEDFDLNRLSAHLKTLLSHFVSRIQNRRRFETDFLASFCFKHMIEMENLVALLECCELGIGNDERSKYLVGVA